MQKPASEQPVPFYYQGFKLINATPVPDDVFDIIAPELEEGELRVLLYVIRRTFGFKKQADDISLRQLVEGIRKKDGELLDRGAGVSKSTAVRAVRGLIDKGIIAATRNGSVEKGYEATTYSLRFQGASTPPPLFHHKTTPLSHHRTRGGSTVEHPLVSPQNIQHDREQHDREQHHARRPRRASGPVSPAGLTDARMGVDDPLLAGLLALGMTHDSAGRVLRDHPADKVGDWLSALPYLPNAKEPAAVLVQALKKNWTLPKQYLQARGKDELAKKKKATREAETQARAAADRLRQDRQVKVDAYLALLEAEELRAMEDEAVQRVRAEAGDYWTNRGIPAVIVKSCVRTLAAERMGLPPLDDDTPAGPRPALTSGEIR